MGGDPPDPPDYGPLAEVSEKLGMEQLDMMRDQFRWSKKQAGKMDRVIDKVTSGALKTERQNRQWAHKQQQRYENVFQPLENEFIKEAQNYDTEGRRDRQAGRAMSDIGQAGDAARDQAERRLASFGIDPSMMRASAMDADARIEEATAKAQAGTDARRRVEDVGRALRADAVNLGRGVPAMAAQGYATALQGGNLAQGATTSGGLAQGQMRTSPAIYAQGAQSSFGSGANILSSAYQNELAAYETSQQYGLPGMLATVGGIAAGSMMQKGGPITKEMSPSRGAIPDDVPVRATVNEYVVPEDVVRWKGEEFFERLKTQVAKAKGGGEQRAA